MKKRIILLMLFMLLIVSVSGCESKEEKILGRWAEEKNGYGWVFRKNGKCSFDGPTYSDGFLISSTDCEWELNNNKITISEKVKVSNGEVSYENTMTTIGTIKDNTLTTEEGGVYLKQN